MLNVMIIDDEDYIREGLKRIIDWNKYGFYICGEASNGVRGLAQIQELKPDLVIVDIKMPMMDGLEMIKELRRDNCACEFIVLSAYSDFKYAQTAIELDIDSYIVKPIEQPVLIEKICKVHDKILSKRQAKQNIDMSIYFSKEKILQSIILNQIDIKMLGKYCSLYGFDFPWSGYRVALIEVEGDQMEIVTVKMSVKKHIDKLISENRLGYVFDIENYIGILIDNLKLTADLRILHDLPVKINELFKTYITVLLGSSVEKLTDISSSYQHACRLSNRKFTLSYKRVISDVIEDTNQMHKCVNTYPKYALEHIVESLCKAVDTENMEQINNILEGLFQKFQSEEYNEGIIKINYSNIYSATLNKLASVNSDKKDKLSIRQEILAEICNKSSLQELHGYMKYIFTVISDELKAERPEDPIAKILEYMERNYNEDLKLETMAALFYYNSDYLGKKIKLRTGKHFNTYLDSIRFEKAKQFLTEGFKVYQVAQKTGFKDINYFYKKFKVYTGVPPSDYKEIR